MSLATHEKLRIEQELKDLGYTYEKDKDLIKFVFNKLEEQQQTIIDLKWKINWLEDEIEDLKD